MNIGITIIICDVQISPMSDELGTYLTMAIHSCPVQGSVSCNIYISIIIFYLILSPRLKEFNQYHKNKFPIKYLSRYLYRF